jgi:ribose 1,5-bisphosphokinase PhnN
MRKTAEIAADLGRGNDRLKNNRAELRKAKRQFGAALVKLVRIDPDFAAALLSLLRRRGKLRGREGAI